MRSNRLIGEIAAQLRPTEWRFRRRQGERVLEVSPWTPNVLTREGSLTIMDTFFRANVASTPDFFEVGLANSTPTIATTALSLSGECSGGGYERIQLARNLLDFPTLAPTLLEDGSPGPYRIETRTATFTAQADDIGPFASAFLVAVIPSGGDPDLAVRALICAATAQGGAGLIPAGQSLDITLRMRVTT